MTNNIVWQKFGPQDKSTHLPLHHQFCVRDASRRPTMSSGEMWGRRTSLRITSLVCEVPVDDRQGRPPTYLVTGKVYAPTTTPHQLCARGASPRLTMSPGRIWDRRTSPSPYRAKSYTYHTSATTTKTNATNHYTATPPCDSLKDLRDSDPWGLANTNATRAPSAPCI